VVASGADLEGESGAGDEEDDEEGGSPVKPGGDDGWNVDGVAVHEESRRVVYSRNVDGYTGSRSVSWSSPTGSTPSRLPTSPRASPAA